MSENFLEVVAQNASKVRTNCPHRAVETVADHVIQAIKAGRELPLADAARPENLHILAAVASEIDESIGGVSEPSGVDLAKVSEVVEAIYGAVAAKMADVRKVTYSSRGGWRVELDCDEVFPDDPGNGTPALVHAPCGATGTLHCALTMGEVDGVVVPDAVSNWLEHFMPLYFVIETRTHAVTRH